MDRPYLLPHPQNPSSYYHVLYSEFKAKSFTPFVMYDGHSRSDSQRCSACYVGMAHSQGMHDRNVQEWEQHKAECKAAGGVKWQAWCNYHDYNPGWD